MAALGFDAPQRPRHVRAMVGTGLVLVGLLGGVLVMQFTASVRNASPTEFRMVDLYASRRDSALEVPRLGGVAELNEHFKHVAGHVIPSVVSVEAATAWRDLPLEWFRNFDGFDSGDRSLHELPRESVGSGVVISPQGYIVTNHHVVEGARRLHVTLQNKVEYPAHLVGVGPGDGSCCASGGHRKRRATASLADRQIGRCSAWRMGACCWKPVSAKLDGNSWNCECLGASGQPN